MGKMTLPGLSTRAAEIAGPPEGADPDSRELLISFSSELPFRRHSFDGPFWEVLGHGAGEADLSRLASGAAPLLKDHMPVLGAQLGVVVRAWIGGGKGWAQVRFSRTAAADDVLTRVRDGDVTCVSVGYAIEEAAKTGEAEGLPVVRVTRWVPREISFVSIPADPTVGVGRADGDVPPVSVTEEEPSMPKTPEQIAAAAAVEAARAAVTAPAPAAADPLAAERARVSEIDAIAERFDVPADLVRSARTSGMAVDAFRAKVMDHISGDDAGETRQRSKLIGLSDREVRGYSLLNVVRFLMNPTDRNRASAGFEIEASRAAADAVGREPGGVFIPEDVLMDRQFMRAAQNTGTPAQGGVLVPTQYLAGSFIELLRARSALASRGVRILQGLTGNVDIPKQTAGATLYWVDEDEDVADSVASFGIVSMTPHTAGMAVPITRRMTQQASPDIEALIRDDLLKGMALGIDRVALVGDASPKAPIGLRAHLLAGAIDWAGVQPTFAEMVSLETSVAMANADLGDLAYIYSPATSGALKTTPRFASGDTPVEVGGVVNGYQRTCSTHVASPEVFFGNWSDLVIGMWSGLDLRVDTATKAASDGKVLRVFADLDVAVRNAASFKLGRNV
ncbi:phage major capsid protein [Paenirhodobacter populi]|uniref:phage major capsid protein n=1 Tax=Paenirhodobacter populi TaxID=2306993 RepID=UPI000FE35AC2|nr:phage major capsid protein [Sinirhodobacter populi]RWR09713.1 phage major capsid protein [Sinirhodobacter populi]